MYIDIYMQVDLFFKSLAWLLCVFLLLYNLLT